MNTFDYEEKFLNLHPSLGEFRDLKEEYVRFNKRNTGNPAQAAAEIDGIISKYLNRKVKDLKRLGRGFRNFEHMRNRFLFTTRKDPIYKSR